MQNDERSISLNRVLAIEQYSLANYLLGAHPWTRHGNQALVEAIHHITEDQRYYAERIGGLLVDREGFVGGGSFPMRFTSFNDLALDYLARELVDRQRQAICQIETCLTELGDDEPARKLVEETLGSEKGHLETLLELTTPPGSSKPNGSGGGFAKAA